MTSSKSSRPLTAAALMRELRACRDPQRADTYAWFFKTGPGEYGEGDRFIGVTMPVIRRHAGRYLALSAREVDVLLRQHIHEYRMVGLVILTEQYKRADTEAQQRIVKQYQANLSHINNWDLVDVSAHKILGAHFVRYGGGEHLHALAKSDRMWDRRVAIVATFAYIARGELELSLQLADLLVHDTHDLMHKAVGWVLREVGKNNRQALDRFLTRHAHHMPRTMLRYAIERHSPAQRAHWLAAHRR